MGIVQAPTLLIDSCHDATPVKASTASATDELTMLNIPGNNITRQLRRPQAAVVFVIRYLRQGVVPAAAAGMAPGNAPDGQPAAFEQTIFLQGFYRVLRAGGRKPAFGANGRRYHVLVYSDQQDKRVTNQLLQQLHRVFS